MSGAARPMQWTEQASVRRVLRRLGPVGTALVSLRDEPITLRAAALTYLTVLSIVPLLAVMFSLFQAVVGTAEMQTQLQSWVLKNLAVGAQESVSRTVSQLVQRASGTAIGGVGFAFLLFSAVSLLGNIEHAFNHAFQATRPRPFALRLGIYWCLLTLGPILLALSLAGTAVVQSVKLAAWMGAVRSVALYAAPSVVTIAAFTLLYLILPAVQVRPRAALTGALVSGISWEVAKIVYATVSASSVRNNAIYGSLSAIPVFLVWTYTSWIFVLFGARVAAAAQGIAPRTSMDALLPAHRERAAVRLVQTICHVFTEGNAPPRRAELARQARVPPVIAAELLQALDEARLIRKHEDGGYLPARPPETLTVTAVVHVIRQGIHPIRDGSDDVSGALLSRAEQAADQVLDVSFAWMEQEKAQHG